MNRYFSFIAAPLLVTLAACSSDSDYDFDASRDTLTAEIAARSAPQALFNPQASVLPFPNSILFGVDGTLDLPVEPFEDQSLANPRVALNQSDGFSTIAPISTTISEPLDPETLILGDTVRVYEVTTVNGVGVTSVVAEISDPLLLAVRSIGDQLVLTPTEPLKAKTDYLVVLTNGITDVDGEPLTASLVYDILKRDQAVSNPELEGSEDPEDMESLENLENLESLRLATLTQVDQVLETSEILRENIALSWVFRTQSIREVLQATEDVSNASTLVFANSNLNTASDTINLQGKGDIYIGTLDVPYYLSAPGEGDNAATALGSYWQNGDGNVVGTVNASGNPDYTPVVTDIQTIPVLMSVPNNSEMPADGWPVTIFQHGFTRSRTDMLAIADALADAGRAVIAIDMPLHGVIDADSLLHADNTPFDADRERTFDIDLAVNPLAEGETAEADAPTTGPDGKADPSGRYFVNLQNLANSRDNLRQAVADLFVLRASLAGATGEGFSLNPNNLSFVGHSLGAMVGTTMLSYDDSYQSASLAMPGGGIAQLLANSPRFGPEINAGLASAGIETGSVDYNTFLIVAQTLLDSADPINHAATLALAATPQLHLLEVIDDQVILNNVANAPLSGTDPLARQLDLSQITETSSTGGLVKFSAGNHGSIIDPSLGEDPLGNLPVTAEMQNQVATFAATQGTELPITNSSVIAPLP